LQLDDPAAVKSCAVPERDRKEAKGIWPTGDDAAVDLVKVAERCKSQTMSKADLISVLADKLKFPWARAELLVDVVFDCMEQSMSRGEKIEVCATRPNYLYTQALVYALGPVLSMMVVIGGIIVLSLGCLLLGLDLIRDRRGRGVATSGQGL
jgi:hypothetical protein